MMTKLYTSVLLCILLRVAQLLKTAKSDIRISGLYWLKFILEILEKKASDLKVGTLAGVLAGFFSRNQLQQAQ